MRRTIPRIAAGAAMWCCALSLAGVSATDAESLGVDGDDATEPSPLVAPRPPADFTIGSEADARSFTWTSDLSLTPPPYTVTATDGHFVPPSTSSTAIPLPPAAWTGFASLGALGAFALVRRLRRIG